MMTHRVQLTVPQKEQPYTQHDMDVVIGHPVRFDMGIRDEQRYIANGTITDAVINEDGSATISAEVQFHV